MIYDMQTLKVKFKDYANLNQKISIEAKKNNLLRIKRGLYTDNLKVDSPVIANICCAPSYLSYEYALSYYGLIPEYVPVYTSACFGKKNNKIFSTKSAIFEYRSIPDDVFPYGVIYLTNEDGIRYKIASKEKALCDILYCKYPVRTLKDLEVLLFSDLRIDEDEFLKLDFEFIFMLASKYRSNSLLTLSKYLKEVSKNGISN